MIGREPLFDCLLDSGGHHLQDRHRPRRTTGIRARTNILNNFELTHSPRTKHPTLNAFYAWNNFDNRLFEVTNLKKNRHCDAGYTGTASITRDISNIETDRVTRNKNLTSSPPLQFG